MLSLSYVTFFLHFSHFLTKVALSLSNFLSISSNPICNILPLVEHQLSIFIFCRTTFEVLVQGGEKEEKRTKETTKGGSRGKDQPRVRDSHHSGKIPVPCNPCAPKILSPLKNPIFFVQIVEEEEEGENLDGGKVEDFKTSRKSSSKENSIQEKVKKSEPLCLGKKMAFEFFSHSFL